jgi:hypothetical protein
MKNRTLVTRLRQFNPELKVSIKAYLQYGCTEKGGGSAEYEGYSLYQEFTTEWNDGHLEANQWDGYNVQDLINVLLEKPLSKIGNKDFRLYPGELMNGNPEYVTTWEDGEPEDTPDDSDLYSLLELGGSEYEWQGASSLEFEVFYEDDYGEDSSISFQLGEDEVDRKPDPLEEKKKKVAPKKKAAKKK